MVKGLAGDPLAMAAIAGGLGGILWWYKHHFQRLTAWLFAAAGWSLALAIPEWRDALAGLASTGPGLVGLLVASLVIGVAFWLQAVRSARPSRLRSVLGKVPGVGGSSKDLALIGDAPRRPDRYHHVHTPIISICAGTLALVLAGSWRLILAAGAKSLTGTGKALITSQQQISSGKAAAQVPAHSRPEILIIGLAVIVVLYLIARARHGGGKKRTQRGGGGRGGGLTALPPGRGA